MIWHDLCTNISCARCFGQKKSLLLLVADGFFFGISKKNRAVCPLVALRYVRRYVRSCCLFRMSLGLILSLVSFSCSRTWWALLYSISALAGVLLSLWSLCYLMLSLCYLCAISVLSLCYLCFSGGGQRFYLCYLCAISVLSMLSHARETFLLCAISVLSLCYLCYLMLSLCYLCAISVLSMLSHAISVLSLCYLCDISLLFLPNLWRWIRSLRLCSVLVARVALTACDTWRSPQRKPPSFSRAASAALVAALPMGPFFGDSLRFSAKVVRTYTKSCTATAVACHLRFKVCSHSSNRSSSRTRGRIFKHAPKMDVGA